MNQDFLESLKRLFQHSRQLQITVSTSEDFGLLKKETPAEYLAWLERNLADMQSGKKTVVYTDSALDDLILRNL